MKVYQALAAALLDHGADVVFGLMGDANMLTLCDYQDRGGRFVPTVHEGGAVSMADGWSRMTGRVGIASVTHGPAVSNTVTALIEAVRSRSRVLLLTGDTPPEPTHFQRLDLAATAAMAEAGYEKVHGPHTLRRDLDRALRRIVTENRPVLLDVPIGLLRADAGDQPPVARPVARTAPVPAPEQLEGSLGLITAARRPVLLAGRGAVLSGARPELEALADRLAAPVAVTGLAKDFFRGHPADLGLFGGLSHGVARSVIADADCVIAFGAGLNSVTTARGKLVRGKKIVQVDADPAAFDWYTRTDEAVHGDARAVAAALTAGLAAAGHTPGRDRLERIRRSLRSYRPADDFQDRTGDGTVDVRTAMLRLDGLLPERRVLVSDVGRFVVGVWPHLRVADARHFTSMGGFGSIGLGLAGAIGAAVACPGELTVAVVGDGGFMMNLAEFTTAVRERLPLLVVVLNDGAYGAEHHKLAHFGVDTARSLTRWPDFVPLAEAMGARGATVRDPRDLDAVADAVRQLDGPFVLDIRLDPEVDVMASLAE